MNPTNPGASPLVRVLVWSFCGLSFAAVMALVYYRAFVCTPAMTEVSILEHYGSLVISPLAVFAIFGALVVTRQPRNPIGWLCCAIGLGLPISFFGLRSEQVQCSLDAGLDWPGLTLYSSLSYALVGYVIIVPVFVLLPLLFPTGRFLSRAWRRFALACLAFFLLSALLNLVWPGPIREPSSGALTGLQNPLALPIQAPPWLDSLVPQSFYLMSIVGLVANLSLIQRFRRARGDERQQIKWMAYYVATAGSLLLAVELLGKTLIPEETWDSSILLPISYSIILILAWGGYPLVVGIAILKYRLYNIDILIRRTLVWGALTLVLGLAYFGGVTLLQAVFSTISNQQSAISIVISTLAIAALFNPLRKRVQAAVDRRFYRRKYDAEQALASFTSLARQEVDLEEISTRLLEVVEETVQPEHVSLWLKPTAAHRLPNGVKEPNAGG